MEQLEAVKLIRLLVRINEVKSLGDQEQPGILPSALTFIFKNLRQNDEKIGFFVNFYEIYNEEIYDLLDPKKKKLQIKEKSDKKFYLPGKHIASHI